MSVLKSVVVGIVLVAVVIGVAVWAKRQTSTTEPYASVSPSVSVIPSVSASVSASGAPVSNERKNNMHEITISTSLGDIAFQTYDADAPKAVDNFIKLANEGFYSNILFHRVIEGFMIQGGDPKTKDAAHPELWGTGGPGYQFADELDPNTESAKIGYVRGTVAMANSGPNTNGSQFFIMHQDYPLPHSYTIFGHVVRGQDVVDKIATTKVDSNDRPLTPVVMKKVTVELLP
jgi:cyclophilin family peptidyl-prolyl cis-trans isomerase